MRRRVCTCVLRRLIQRKTEPWEQESDCLAACKFEKITLLGSSLVALVLSNSAKPNESLAGYYFPFHLPVMDRWRLSVYCDSAIMMMGSTWWQAWCSSDDDRISDWTDVIITSSLSWVVPLRLNFHSFQKHRYRYMIMQQPLRSFIQWYIVRLPVHSLATGVRMCVIGTWYRTSTN